MTHLKFEIGVLHDKFNQNLSKAGKQSLYKPGQALRVP
jgi:hypothetical protein